jgi:hypothetical protein
VAVAVAAAWPFHVFQPQDIKCKNQERAVEVGREWKKGRKIASLHLSFGSEGLLFRVQ